MADTAVFTSDDSTARGSFFTAIGTFLSKFGRGYSALLAAQSRADEFERLNAKTDAELEKMGLTREGLARHVFRDMLHM